MTIEICTIITGVDIAFFFICQIGLSIHDARALGTTPMHSDPFNGDAGPPFTASWITDVQSTVIGYIIRIPTAWATSTSGQGPWRNGHLDKKEKTHAHRPEPDGAGESIKCPTQVPSRVYLWSVRT